MPPGGTTQRKWLATSGTSESKCLSLLVALLLLMVFQPFFGANVLGRAVIGVLVIFVLVAALWALGHKRRGRTLVIGSLSAASLIYYSVVGEDHSGWLAALLSVFLIDVLVSFFGFVMAPQVPRRARLLAALCVYMLLGVTWAMLYATGFWLDPDAFELGPHAKVDGGATIGAFVYFSFVTLTTLGYGDIQPMSPVARSLALLEAVVGVLYVAVMVASLVTSGTESSKDS